MKKYIYMLLAAAALFAAGCTDDPTSDPVPVGEGETWVSVGFGHRSYERVTINTRAALTEAAESRVSNLYVFVFDSKGNRVYGHYFDRENLLESETDVRNALRECWYVDNMVDATKAAQTRGTVRVRVPKISGGGEIFMLANIDADMVNISPERLNYIHTKKDLNGLEASLNQQITSRNGYFPMNGSAENIVVTDTSISSTSSADGSVDVPLRRLDAKIEVNIKIAKGSSSTTDIEYDPDGSGNFVTTTRKQEILEFRPESWQVINLPKGCYVCRRDKKTQSDYDADLGYFSSRPNNFDSSNDEKSSFSFYMLENRPDAKRTSASFNDRDRRIKNADTGEYDTSDGLWVNAPEDGTYLVIKGEIAMNVDVGVEAKDQKLNAMVTYYIHLGDFKSSNDNYDIERNTHYVYNITIKGVDKIQAEVEKNVEDEPAATGHVYIAKESIHTFDAHYGKRAFSFDEAFISPATVTWYVKTPFGREGTPEIINGVEVPNGLDYKWVHFIINDPENPDDPASPYSRVQKCYDPKEAMDVTGFVAFIKEQKSIFDARKEKFPDNPSEWIVENAFRPEKDTDYPDGSQTRYRIWATVFVDEYYYEEDPISGTRSTTLWKRFVNQPHRIMHLLCDTQYSKDRESLATGSVVTIRQRSIQSIFDSNSTAETAWGLETEDEMAGKLWFYDSRETTAANNNYCPDPGVSEGNDSQGNGLYNSLKLWKLIDGSGNFVTGKRWDDYLVYARENDHELCFLRDDPQYKTARYACMMRNRDNNGNGVIDASEVRWYLASIRQLINLYIGQGGFSDDAKLYSQKQSDYYDTGKEDQEQEKENGFFKWRSHIISSTLGTTYADGGKTWYYPKIIWAEEGLSTSVYRQPERWSQSGSYSIRCVRNLGTDYASEEEAQRKIVAKEAPFIPVTGVSGPGIDDSQTPTENSVYRFDLSNMNAASIRFYTSKELEPSDQFSEMSRPYYGFETCPNLVTTYDYENDNYNGASDGMYRTLISELEAGESPCPAGYRMPNMRELALMSEYLPSGWWNGKAYYAISYLAADKRKYWKARHGQMTMGATVTTVTIRCVRDVR